MPAERTTEATSQADAAPLNAKLTDETPTEGTPAEGTPAEGTPAEGTPAASAAPGAEETHEDAAGPGSEPASDVTGAIDGQSGQGTDAEHDTTREVTVVPGVPRYHNADCILIRFMSADDLEHPTLADAEAAGCTPCRACLPS